MRIECDRCKKMCDIDISTKIQKGCLYTEGEIYICIDCTKSLDKWLDNENTNTDIYNKGQN